MGTLRLLFCVLMLLGTEGCSKSYPISASPQQTHEQADKAPAGRAAKDGPPEPWESHQICLHECCVTGEGWLAKAGTKLYRQRNLTSLVVFKFEKQTPVVLADGYVISAHAGRAKMCKDMKVKEPGTPRTQEVLTKDTIVYLLGHTGEGYWTVWFGGRARTIDFSGMNDDCDRSDSVLLEMPARLVAWALLRTKNGVEGWTLDENIFASDALLESIGCPVGPD